MLVKAVQLSRWVEQILHIWLRGKQSLHQTSWESFSGGFLRLVGILSILQPDLMFVVPFGSQATFPPLHNKVKPIHPSGGINQPQNKPMKRPAQALSDPSGQANALELSRIGLLHFCSRGTLESALEMLCILLSQEGGRRRWSLREGTPALAMVWDGGPRICLEGTGSKEAFCWWKEKEKHGLMEKLRFWGWIRSGFKFYSCFMLLVV